MDDVDIEQLIAYLPDEIRKYGKEIVEVIEGIGYLERTEEENKRIVFKVGDQPIAEIEYTEENFRVRYRNREGDMIYAGPAIYSEEVYKSNKERIKHLVSGAYRKWVVIEINKHFSEIERMVPFLGIKDLIATMRKITTQLFGQRTKMSDEYLAFMKAVLEMEQRTEMSDEYLVAFMKAMKEAMKELMQRTEMSDECLAFMKAVMEMMPKKCGISSSPSAKQTRYK